MSARSLVLATLFVAGCGSLDAEDNHRTDAEAENQAWWWLWSPDEGTDEADEVEMPREPGDPLWFDAHCDEHGCRVADDFDPIAHLELAYDLCAEELAVDDALYFQRVSFSTERTYADELLLGDAEWEYRFVVPDPDDLWGNIWLECYVRVNDGAVVTDSTYTAGTITRIDALLGQVHFGVLDALDDLGGLASVNRGGIRWDRISHAGEVYLADDQWDDVDTWNANTGERDW